MEELQIQEFVRRAVMDKTVRCELALDPGGVIERGGYSSRVANILFRLVPCLAFEQPLNTDEKWWHA